MITVSPASAALLRVNSGACPWAIRGRFEVKRTPRAPSGTGGYVDRARCSTFRLGKQQTTFFVEKRDAVRPVEKKKKERKKEKRKRRKEKRHGPLRPSTPLCVVVVRGTTSSTTVWFLILVSLSHSSSPSRARLKISVCFFSVWSAELCHGIVS